MTGLSQPGLWSLPIPAFQETLLFSFPFIPVDTMLAQLTGDLLESYSPGEGLPGSISAPKTWLTPDKPRVPRLFIQQ